MKPAPRPLAGVFFDLDGTLVDSAPDMHAALRALCVERGLATPPFVLVRETVSRGVRAVLACALGEDDAAVDAAVPRFLELYTATGMYMTQTFPGVDALLSQLESRGIPWGVVSNKAGDLVQRMLVKLGYAARAAAVVGGDTLAVRKPDPAPVLHACTLAAVDPRQCVFVGDDPRDIQAGRAAGLATVAAAWGYLGGVDPASWQPDRVASDPAALGQWLGMAPPAEAVALVHQPTHGVDPALGRAAVDDGLSNYLSQWREARPERTTAWLFLTPVERIRCGALAALLQEWIKILRQVTEPQVAAIKLGWWRDELQRAAAGAPTHPLTKALFADPRGRTVPVADWVAAVDATALAVGAPPAASFQAQLEAITPLAEAFARIELQIWFATTVGVSRVCQAWAVGRLMADLRALVAEADRGRSPLPMNLLARHGLVTGSLTQDGPARRAAVHDYVLELQQALSSVAKMQGPLPLFRAVQLDADRVSLARACRSADPMQGLLVPRRGFGNLLKTWRAARMWHAVAARES